MSSSLSDALEDRKPTYDQAAAMADALGAEVANAYTAGYWRAIQDLRELEDQARV